HATSVQEAMIKRLRDDPATLVTARPDLRFPPGLQETLDGALARGPTERYQSAAKFANDVAGVVGSERRGGLVTPLPATRDHAEEKTQLLEPAPPLPPPKRRPPGPILAGARGGPGGAGGAAPPLAGGSRTA